MQYSQKIILGKYRAHVVFSLRKQSTFTMYEIFIGRCRKMQQNYMKPFRRKLWLYCHVLSLSDVEFRIPSWRKISFYEKDAEISLFGQIWWSSIFIFWIFLNIYEIETRIKCLIFLGMTFWYYFLNFQDILRSKNSNASN